MRRMPTGKQLEALEKIKVDEDGTKIFDLGSAIYLSTLESSDSFIKFENDNYGAETLITFANYVNPTNTIHIIHEYNFENESVFESGGNLLIQFYDDDEFDGYPYSDINPSFAVSASRISFGYPDHGAYFKKDGTSYSLYFKSADLETPNRIFANVDGMNIEIGKQTLYVTDSNIVTGPSVGSSKSIYLLNFGNDGSLVYYDSDIDKTVFDISPTPTSTSATLFFNENRIDTSISDVNETINFFHGDNQNYIGYSQEDGFQVYAIGTTLSLYGENGIIAKQNIRQPAVYLSGTLHSDETTSVSIGSYSIKYMPFYDENGDVVGGQGTIAIELTTAASDNTIYLSGDLPNNFIGGVANVSANQFSLIGGYTGGTRAKIVFVQVTPQAGTYEGSIMIYNN